MTEVEDTLPSARAFVGVGTNLQPEENVVGALELLESHAGIRIVGISTFYRTPALPPPEPHPDSIDYGPDYLNGVVELHTALGHPALARALEEIEVARGRVRSAGKYAPRTMDLDLLLFLPSIPQVPAPRDRFPSAPPPHPEIRSRAFVAVPLLELAPDLLLPPDGTPLSEVAEVFPGPGGTADLLLTEQLRKRFLESRPHPPSSGTA